MTTPHSACLHGFRGGSELEEHHPQVGLHRRGWPTDPRVEERHERNKERRIIQQPINPGELSGHHQHPIREHRLTQRHLIAQERNTMASIPLYPKGSRPSSRSTTTASRTATRPVFRSK